MGKGKGRGTRSVVRPLMQRQGGTENGGKWGQRSRRGGRPGRGPRASNHWNSLPANGPRLGRGGAYLFLCPLPPPADSGATTRLQAVIAGCGAAAAKFQAVSDRCAALAPRLPEPGRTFFDRGLRRQAAFMAATSRSAVAAAEAARDVHDREAYRRRMQAVEDAVREMETLLADAPSGLFAGWYAPESIFKLGETKSMVERRLNGIVPKPPEAPETP